MQPRNIAAGIALGAFVTMAASTFAASEKKDVAAIEQAVAGDWRKPEAKERDADRHPAASLEFWGLKPKMTILEVQPGGGWWTEILAPYARATQGEFYATAPDLADPDLSENAKKGRANFEARWANADVYGKVNLVNGGPKAAPLPADKFDFVMLTRGMHGWVRDGSAEANLANIFNAVKPGGVLAIEQHRAKPGQDPKVFNGYLDEAYLLLNREEYPSWLYPVKQGATTIWERWDGQKPDGSFQDPSMNSFNHYAYGAIGEWMYRVMAGIEIDESAPGYKRALIQPRPGGGYTRVAAQHETPYGRLSSSWKLEGGRFVLDVEVPPNTTARVRVPAGSASAVTESGRPLAAGNGIAAFRQDGDAVVVEVGSGRYAFASTMAR